MLYVLVSSDGSLPKEPKGDGSSQIAGTHTHTHAQALLLYLIISVMSVCLEMAEETGFNLQACYSDTLLKFRCDYGRVGASSSSVVIALFTPRCFWFHLQSLRHRQGSWKDDSGRFWFCHRPALRRAVGVYWNSLPVLLKTVSPVKSHRASV